MLSHIRGSLRGLLPMAGRHLRSFQKICVARVIRRRKPDRPQSRWIAAKSDEIKIPERRLVDATLPGKTAVVSLMIPERSSASTKREHAACMLPSLELERWLTDQAASESRRR